MTIEITEISYIVVVYIIILENIKKPLKNRKEHVNRLIVIFRTSTGVVGLIMTLENIKKRLKN